MPMVMIGVDRIRARTRLRDALEFRAQILEQSRDEFRARAERELDRLRQGDSRDKPTPPARRRSASRDDT